MGLLGMALLMGAAQVQAQVVDPLTTARETGRPALIHFTGSDWCANCKAFERDVLSKPAVHSALDEHFVHYVADRPVRKKLDPQVEQLNHALVERFNPGNTFPLLVVVAPDGTVLDRIGYDRSMSADRYVERLRRSSPTP